MHRLGSAIREEFGGAMHHQKQNSGLAVYGDNRTPITRQTKRGRGWFKEVTGQVPGNPCSAVTYRSDGPLPCTYLNFPAEYAVGHFRCDRCSRVENLKFSIPLVMVATREMFSFSGEVVEPL